MFQRIYQKYLPELQLKVGDNSIENVSWMKNLGVFFDIHLTIEKTGILGHEVMLFSNKQYWTHMALSNRRSLQDHCEFSYYCQIRQGELPAIWSVKSHNVTDSKGLERSFSYKIVETGGNDTYSSRSSLASRFFSSTIQKLDVCIPILHG